MEQEEWGHGGRQDEDRRDRDRMVTAWGTLGLGERGQWLLSFVGDNLGPSG